MLTHPDVMIVMDVMILAGIHNGTHFVVPLHVFYYNRKHVEEQQSESRYVCRLESSHPSQSSHRDVLTCVVNTSR